MGPTAPVEPSLPAPTRLQTEPIADALEERPRGPLHPPPQHFTEPFAGTSTSDLTSNSKRSGRSLVVHNGARVVAPPLLLLLPPPPYPYPPSLTGDPRRCFASVDGCFIGDSSGWVARNQKVPLL